MAEATGGHAYIVPALIGAAVAYAVSGEASISGDQRLHEGVRVAELSKIRVSGAMQKHVIAADARSSVGEFADYLRERRPHTVYPVLDDKRVAGTISTVSLSALAPEQWDRTQVREVMNRDVELIAPDCDLRDALRLLMEPHGPHMLIVASEGDGLKGIVTKADILSALNAGAAADEDLRTEMA